jgi:hypothetical protein
MRVKAPASGLQGEVCPVKSNLDILRISNGAGGVLVSKKIHQFRRSELKYERQTKNET